MIYQPEKDSYLLQKQVRLLVKGKVLDMGTGSAIQAKTALENTKDVLAVDINKEAVNHCKKQNINAIQSNLFENIKDKFDWILFNPPYLPEDAREPQDSKLATTGGKKGDEIILKFLEQARNHLKPNGQILILISSLTGDPETLFKDYTYTLLDKENLFMEQLFVYKLSNK
jgi:release factor glutamine methyltransferase